MTDEIQTTTETARTAETEAPPPPPAPTTEQRRDPPKRIKLMLDVALTDRELAAIGKRAAAKSADIATTEAEKKAANDDFKEAITEAETERDRLLAALANGTEKRLVECIEEHIFATNTVLVTRCDTGEKVSERAMHWGERQGTLPGTDAPATDDDGEAEEPQVDASERDEEPSSEAGEDEHIDDPQAVLDGKAKKPKRDAKTVKTSSKRAKKKGGAK